MYCNTIYHNGTIYTIDDEMPLAHWAAVDNGRIVAIGQGDVPHR